jgi:hypothetical protein
MCLDPVCLDSVCLDPVCLDLSNLLSRARLPTTRLEAPPLTPPLRGVTYLILSGRDLTYPYVSTCRATHNCLQMTCNVQSRLNIMIAIITLYCTENMS